MEGYFRLILFLSTPKMLVTVAETQTFLKADVASRNSKEVNYEYKLNRYTKQITF